MVFSLYKYSLCEVFTKKLLPSIKLYLAYRLIRDFNYSQLRVSNILGVKQPLINYFLSGRRKPRLIDFIQSNSEFRRILDNIAYDIASTGFEQNNCIACRICIVLRKTGFIEDILRKIGIDSREVYIPR